MLACISSPYARRGELWRAYNEHFGAKGDEAILVAQGASRDLNPSLSERVVARAYERDAASAAAEYGGLFRSDVESFVISHGTALTLKGKPVDAKQIGRELGVRYLLEGSVRRSGEKIEVNAQLISTEIGAHAWADRFDGERSKLGELQVEAVSRLANSLGVQLVKAEALRAISRAA